MVLNVCFLHYSRLGVPTEPEGRQSSHLSHDGPRQGWLISVWVASSYERNHAYSGQILKTVAWVSAGARMKQGDFYKGGCLAIPSNRSSCFTVRGYTLFAMRSVIGVCWKELTMRLCFAMAIWFWKFEKLWGEEGQEAKAKPRKTDRERICWCIEGSRFPYLGASTDWRSAGWNLFRMCHNNYFARKPTRESGNEAMTQRYNNKQICYRRCSDHARDSVSLATAVGILIRCSWSLTLNSSLTLHAASQHRHALLRSVWKTVVHWLCNHCTNLCNTLGLNRQAFRQVIICSSAWLSFLLNLLCDHGYITDITVPMTEKGTYQWGLNWGQIYIIVSVSSGHVPIFELKLLFIFYGTNKFWILHCWRKKLPACFRPISAKRTTQEKLWYTDSLLKICWPNLPSLNINFFFFWWFPVAVIVSKSPSLTRWRWNISSLMAFICIRLDKRSCMEIHPDYCRFASFPPNPPTRFHMHVLTPLHIVLLAGNLFISLLVVLLNSLALAYFEVARHMSNSSTVYLTSVYAQDTPTSQTEPRDYILIIIGLISSVACLAMILSDLRRMCCGCWKEKEQDEQKRPSIIVELFGGLPWSPTPWPATKAFQSAPWLVQKMWPTKSTMDVT